MSAGEHLVMGMGLAITFGAAVILYLREDNPIMAWIAALSCVVSVYIAAGYIA